MRRWEGRAWAALTLAAASALLVVVRVTETFGRGSIFCSNTACFVEGVLWSFPGYAAMLAVVVADVLIAAALVRAGLGPSSVRLAALAAALAGGVAYVVAALVTLDFAWAGAFSGRLTPPAPVPLMPPALVTLTPSLWAISMILVGVSIALISLLLVRLRAPRSLVVLGWIAGVAIATLVASTQRVHAVYPYAVPIAFLMLSAWAFWLAMLLKRTPRAA
ncbi:MAG: hypothetical protein ABI466_00010 [Chloroflexota bacterium]